MINKTMMCAGKLKKGIYKTRGRAQYKAQFHKHQKRKSDTIPLHNSHFNKLPF